MVFSSFPPYFDPSQWQQQASYQSAVNNGGASSFQLLPHLPPPPGAGSIRPGSMVDRARMANLPLPESAVKCPRCESTNTKFCYFNNYSLSQPRHFCKTCRRYWTRGGALRSVPVGGGYRRNNKRNKSTSRSPVNSRRQTSGEAETSRTETQTPSSKITSSLHQLSAGAPMSLNYNNAISAANSRAGDQNFPAGTANFLGLEQIPWRRQLHLPATAPPLAAASGGLYGSNGEGSSGYNMFEDQQKMEENGREMNMGRRFVGVSASDHHYWSGFFPS